MEIKERGQNNQKETMKTSPILICPCGNFKIFNCPRKAERRREDELWKRRTIKEDTENESKRNV